MTQLRQEGWIHHIARHAVACFLTRGDLWISWEEGMKVQVLFLRDIFLCAFTLTQPENLHHLSNLRDNLPFNVIWYG